MSEQLKTQIDRVLDDPGAKAVASLYAQSYMTSAQQSGVEDACGELESFVTEVLCKGPEFRSLLFSDSLSREDKLGLISRVLTPNCSEYFSNFLKVLVHHGRIDLVDQVQKEAVLVQEQLSGQRRVQIRTSKPLSESSRSQITDQLKNKLGFDPIMQESVDESLIGGLIIQVGDTVYDSSLRTRLKTLAGRLTERTLNEIQSGRDRFSHPEGN